MSDEMSAESATEPKKRTRVSDQDFITAWNVGNNAQEVADALDLERASVVQRACSLRKELAAFNITLKKFPRNQQGVAKKDAAYWAEMAKWSAENGCEGDFTMPAEDSSESDDS